MKHPLKIGTNVKYLSPRCPCSGKRWEVMTGVIIHVNTKARRGEVHYGIRGDKHNIPAKGIVEIIT